MFECGLFNSRSQIATAARWKLVPLVLGGLLLWCQFTFDVFGGSPFALACLLVLFSENVARKCVGTERRIHPKNKAVLVTGCDTGFGYQIAVRLASRGFQVFAGCLRPLEEGWRELSALPRVHCLEMDVSKEGDVERALKEVSEHLEENDLWAVINNAGISKGSEVDLTPMVKIEEVLGVNLLGTIRVTKAALPLLRKSKGRIVNVASIAGRLMMPGYVPYSVSKQAVIAFSSGLRMEVQKFGVSVISIEPWMYQTRLSDPSLIGRGIEQQWTSVATGGTRDAYSDSYLRDLKKNTSRLFSGLRNPNVEEVIDDMEDAVTCACAPLHYRPGRWYLNAYLWLIGCLPQAMADYVTSNWVFGSHAAP